MFHPDCTGVVRLAVKDEAGRALNVNVLVDKRRTKVGRAVHAAFVRATRNVCDRVGSTDTDALVVVRAGTAIVVAEPLDLSGIKAEAVDLQSIRVDRYIMEIAGKKIIPRDSLRDLKRAVPDKQARHLIVELKTKPCFHCDDAGLVSHLRAFRITAGEHMGGFLVSHNLKKRTGDGWWHESRVKIFSKGERARSVNWKPQAFGL